MPTQGDSTDEPNGTVTVQVEAGTGYTVGTTGSADVAVNDDDGAIVPTITISGGSAVTEGTAAEFTVTASTAPSAALTVSLTVSESANGDYVAATDEGSKTVTIAANAKSATYSVPTQGDSTDEPNGTVTVRVASGTDYAVGTIGSADVTVNDDDGRTSPPPPPSTVPTITISGGSAVTEGTAAEFTVTANPAPRTARTVSLTVSESAGSDYVAASDEGAKTVAIDANATTATWSVPTQDDSTDEPNGTVTVQVAAGTGYTVGTTSSANVAVIDDDDERPPGLRGAVVSGTTLTLVFDEALDTSTAPPASAFSVAGTETPVGVVAAAFDPGDAARLVLTLSQAVLPGLGVTVSYVKPGAHPLHDGAGNEVADFGNVPVTDTLPDETEHRVPFAPSASDPLGRQGFVRVVNHSAQAGAVSILAIDDAGVEHGPATLDIEAHHAVHFNSADLEEGNAGKGLADGVGDGEGDWRLVLTSDLDVEVLSYIRTADGFVTSMHQVVPGDGAGSYRVGFFNPGSNRNQVSRLRLTNPGQTATAVRIAGTDDVGEAGESEVTLTLAPRASRTLSAQALESGESEELSGALGDGEGKWRLVVTADQPIRVMSLLASPTGHLTNLSAAPERP